MFTKKNDESGAKPAEADKAPEAEDEIDAPPLKPFSRKGSHMPAKPPAGTSAQPDMPRRPPDIPGGPRRVERPRAGMDSSSDPKRLMVGRDICLKGEITACDKLVVEGQVEVTLPAARLIEVAPSGVFMGDADVEDADISGKFEGELTVRGRLIVRTGGRIEGKVRYGRIEIEQGGVISGDMQTLEPAGDG